MKLLRRKFCFNRKSLQHNDIPTKFIKLCELVLAPILTHLFNICINEASYPDCFKIAQITPIYKSADQTNCNNSLIKYSKKYYTPEYMHIYRSIYCYPIICIVLGQSLQLPLQWKIFMPSF